ncbi:MAG: hypothetical protein PHF84_12645 [bacterium]|nr:hypothetical protein [bacterium]
MAVAGEKIVMLAIQIESAGIEFYTALKRMFSPHSSSFEIIESLLLDEYKHKKTYEILLNKIKVEKKKIIEITPKEIEGIRALVEGKIFDQTEKAVKYVSQNLDLSQLLLYALGFELDTNYLFEKLEEKIIPAEKEIIRTILKEERTHIEKIIKLRAEIKYDN